MLLLVPSHGVGDGSCPAFWRTAWLRSNWALSRGMETANRHWNEKALGVFYELPLSATTPLTSGQEKKYNAVYL